MTRRKVYSYTKKQKNGKPLQASRLISKDLI